MDVAVPLVISLMPHGLILKVGSGNLEDIDYFFSDIFQSIGAGCRLTSPKLQDQLFAWADHHFEFPFPSILKHSPVEI